jgi:hypothetical protein
MEKDDADKINLLLTLYQTVYPITASEEIKKRIDSEQLKIINNLLPQEQGH